MAGETVRRTTIDFADFSVGEFGSLGSWNAPKGSFTGQNVVRYVDGSLGPRNGLKALTVTGLPASALGTHMGINNDGYLYFQTGTLVKTIVPVDTSSQAATAIGDATVDLGQSALVGSYVYAGTSGSGVKKLNFTAPSVTSVASSPNGGLLIQYGERTLVAGDGSQPQRIYYSAAGNPESWPASNFIDVGTGNTIKAMLPLRGGVAIYTVGSLSFGLAGRWWILTGVPGVNDTLREVLTGTQGPVGDADITLPGDGTVLFAASKSETIGTFNGSSVGLLRHLSLGTPPAMDVCSAIGLREESDALVLRYASATANSCVGYMRRDRGWYKQAFAEADVWTRITSRDGTLPSAIAAESYAQNLVIFSTSASPPVFYIWQAYNDRPPFSGDYSATILSPANVYFELPEWWARDGEDVAVRKVIVSFKDWDTDDSNANQFDVTVTPCRQYADGTAGGEATAITKSWSRATSASIASGANLRMDFGIEGSWGNGFKLKIANMRGVAIQKIQVVLHARPIAGV